MSEPLEATDRAGGVHRLREQAIRRHEMHFGHTPTHAVAAPGRVNLIGEHTDYNAGFVLPMAIERWVLVAASPVTGSEKRIRVYSAAYEAGVNIPLDSSLERGEPGWANYVRGIVAGFRNRGHVLDALDLTIMSSMPVGSGLSSSAALEVAVASAIERACAISLEPLDKARLCQTAEHDFALVPCGLMDQLASVFGRNGNALFIDCRSLKMTLVPLSDPDVTVLVCNTNVRHTLADGQYAKRRTECQQTAQLLGVESLRDATMDALLRNEGQLHPPTFQRARHVITENRRAEDFAAALARGDLSRAGRLMYESHHSLRDDFEVSCSELDILVAAAEELGEANGIYGSRMTGGGFGGSTVSLVRSDRIGEVNVRLSDRYRTATGLRLDAFITRPSEGVVWQA